MTEDGAHVERWLLDAYRTSCTQKGRLPKKWLEKRLLTIPASMKGLAIKLTPPEGEPPLSRTELTALIEILLTPRKASRPEGRLPLKGLPLAAALAAKRRRAAFVIPNKEQNAPIPTESPRAWQRPLPLQSLQLGGPAISGAVLQELVFHCTQLSQDCVLKDLVISAADLQPKEADFVEVLSMCGPLRRSLRKLVVEDCLSFGIGCEYAWALFFGTTPLEHLTLRNTAMDVQQFGVLCEILCENEVPQKCLKVLKLRLALALAAGDGGPLSDLEFVHVKRCLSQLRTLKHFEMDGLSPMQRTDLEHEWRVLKGEGLGRASSTVLGTTVVLSLDGRGSPGDVWEEDVVFEMIPALRARLRPDAPTLQIKSYQPFKMRPGGCRAQSRGPRTAASRQTRPLLRQRQRQQTLESCQEIQGAAFESLAEKLWAKFKPPTRPLRSSPTLEQRSSGQRQQQSPLYPSHRRRHRTQPLECYFPLQEALASSRSSSPASSPVPDLESRDSFRKRQRTAEGSQMHQQERKCRAPGLRTEKACVLEDVMSAGSSVDLAEEKLYGPPPGGRTVALPGAEIDTDLKGYMSDGFIRPDNEVVYTTDASDEEIEKDLDVLCRPGRRLLPFSSSSSDQGSQPDCEPSPDPAEEVAAIGRGGETTAGEARGARTTDLEKELQELRPFYYDKHREKYQPGQFFSGIQKTDTRAGVCLRSGRRIHQTENGAQPQNAAFHEKVNLLTDDSDERVSSRTPEKNEMHCQLLYNELDVQSRTERPHKTQDHENERHEAQSVNQTDCPPTVVYPDPSATEEVMEDMSAGGAAQTQGAEERRIFSPMKRCQGNREVQRLQFWAWDHRFEEFPPNATMYLTHTNRRRKSAEKEPTGNDSQETP